MRFLRTARSWSYSMVFSACTASSEFGEDRLGGRDLVAHRHPRLRRRFEIDVHPRAEPDESVTLPTPERGAGFDGAKDPARNEASDLHAGHVMAVGCAQVQRVALVLERGLVERGVHEAAGVIPAIGDGAVDRAAVRVNFKHVSEHADL